MIEQVVHPYNLQRALRQVIVNKGSAGMNKDESRRTHGLLP